MPTIRISYYRCDDHPRYMEFRPWHIWELEHVWVNGRNPAITTWGCIKFCQEWEFNYRSLNWWAELLNHHKYVSFQWGYHFEKSHKLALGNQTFKSSLGLVVWMVSPIGSVGNCMIFVPTWSHISFFSKVFLDLRNISLNIPMIFTNLFALKFVSFAFGSFESTEETKHSNRLSFETRLGLICQSDGWLDVGFEVGWGHPIASNTIDGRNPANHVIGSFSHEF